MPVKILWMYLHIMLRVKAFIALSNSLATCVIMMVIQRLQAAKLP
jgi:hypothetical protein